MAPTSDSWIVPTRPVQPASAPRATAFRRSLGEGGKERPYVATPVSWDEVEAGAEDPLELDQFLFQEVLERVEEHGDLLAGLP